MKKVWYVLSMALILLIASCQSDNPSMITLGLDDTYVVERMKGLTLHPGFTGERYEWALSYESDSVSVTDSIVATTRDYTFVASETGTYRLRFQIYDAANPITHLMRIVVRKEEVAYSPYITKVYEYRPAPGQFVNELPKYTEGDTEESMRQKVEDCLAYDARTMVSLGGYGGYIVVGFDHTIVNRPGEYDFKILGNAFYANDNPRPDAPLGGSSEPGIVMVSVDTNGNGVPDDEWYELAGSEYYKKETLKNMVKEYGLSSCLFLTWQEREMLPYSLGAADVAVVTLNDETAQVSVPSKTYNLLAVGVPLLCIASKHSELAGLISCYNNGVCFDKNAIHSMADYILSLKNNLEYYKQLSDNSLNAAKYFTFQNAKKYV